LELLGHALRDRGILVPMDEDGPRSDWQSRYAHSLEAEEGRLNATADDDEHPSSAFLVVLRAVVVLVIGGVGAAVWATRAGDVWLTMLAGALSVLAFVAAVGILIGSLFDR
jgi:hypothetical protein